MIPIARKYKYKRDKNTMKNLTRSPPRQDESWQNLFENKTLVSRRFVRKTSCQHDILSASWLRRFVRKTSCQHDILSARHFVREFLCVPWPALDVLSGLHHFFNFWVLTGTFGYFWVLTGTFGYFWVLRVLFGTFGYFGVFLGTSGYFGVLFVTYGYFWVLWGT